MNRLIVAGIVNVEFNVHVREFPVPYSPSTLTPIAADVSGVGFNLSAALAALGTPTTLLSFVGSDPLGRTAEEAVRDQKLWGPGIVRFAGVTPHSIVLHDRQGRRAVFTDLAGVPDRVFPEERLPGLFENGACAILTNVGFTRPLLRVARECGLLIACDIHAVADLHDEYNRQFMSQSDVLFMSGERLPVPPSQWLEMLLAEYATCRVAVVGMGAEGCCIKVRGDVARLVPAVTPRPVVNTVGAGDALFASFMHYYVQGMTPYDAIMRASVFAGWKVGESGGSQGFPSPSRVEVLVQTFHSRIISRSRP